MDGRSAGCDKSTSVAYRRMQTAATVDDDDELERAERDRARNEAAVPLGRAMLLALE